MTTDLVALVATGVLSLALAFLPGLSRTHRPGGLAWGIGNRDAPPKGDDPPWVGRAERAHRNLLENIPLFTILVLAAHVSAQNDETTAIASVAYLAARIAHAITYITGVTLLRTAAFYLSLAAELVIAWQLFT